MKKIGIVTINDNNNYGNRLQCFALQEFIKKQGYEALNLNFNKGNLKEYMKNIIKFIINYKGERAKNKRRKIFNKFNKKYINYYKGNGIKNRDFSSFIVGSDQVWNPYFNTTNKNNFLTFAPKEKKNSYAASFGISKLPYACRQKYYEYLQDFKNISVREESGSRIIVDLLDRKDVQVLLDPTMLLEDNEWSKLAKKPRYIPKRKYILNYFLGELSIERKKNINKFAEEHDCEIINILDINSEYFISGPSEFLYLEKNAELICTDSFHSTVFAILFNRPFIVFDREDKKASMNSRIETLLKKFKLENRIFYGTISEEFLNSDYNVSEILEQEKEKSRKFIEKIMKED